VNTMIGLENGRRGNQSSSLQVFCRVDVGVLFRGGRGYYYVSELERSLTTALSQNMGLSGMWTMLDSAVLRIPLYISGSQTEV
jgi:hypothetical protein